MLKILDVIGESPSLDHFDLGVQKGRMISAVSFFVDQLGWIEIQEREVDGDWGYARFVAPRNTTSISLQLTELIDNQEQLKRLANGHIGLKVSDPARAAEAAAEWARRGGLKEIEIEKVPGNKYFVYLGDIFMSEIEFVPR